MLIVILAGAGLIVVVYFLAAALVSQGVHTLARGIADDLRTCPHGDRWDDCPDCRH